MTRYLPVEDRLVKNKESTGFGWVFLTALQSLGEVKW